MSETTLELQIRDNAAEAARGLAALESILVRIQNAAAVGRGLTTVANGITRITNAMQNAIPEASVARIERLANAFERLSNVGNIRIPNARQVADAAVQGVQEPLEAAQRTIHGVVETARDGAEAINDAAGQIGDMNEQAQQAAHGNLRQLAQRFREITAEARNANRPLTNLLGAFIRIARFRLIRTVIKEITQGIKTGLENVKAYSKVIGSDYYKAVLSASSVTLKMKNSLGAALAPALQALIPLLKIVVNWVITAANWFNQLVSLLTGAATWTHAIDPSADLMEKIEGDAQGADKALKNLLADWDELNIIQSKSGSNGGGGNNLVNEDYLNMFEQVDIFDGKIRQVSEFIKKNWDAILNDAKLIGAAILAWEISPLFGGVLSTLAALGVFGVTVKLTWDMSMMMNNEYLDTKEPGWLIADVLTTALGAFVGYRVLSVVGRNFAWAAIPITLVISATAGIVATIGHTDVSALDKENLIAAIENAAKAGVAAGYLLYQTTGLMAGEAIAAGAGAALVTFGVAIGVKAVAQSVKDGEITSETFKAEALAAVGIATGATMLARIFGFSSAGSLLIGGGAMLASVGLMVGVKAIVDAANSEGIDSQNFTEAALSAVGIGVGAGMIGGSALGLGTGNAALMGAGATLAYVGLYLGINAIASAKDSTSIDSTTFIRSALSAVGIGSAASMIAASLGFAHPIVLGAIAGGAVLGSLLLYVGLNLKTDEDHIAWGDEELTREQVENWVSDRMFTVNAKATVNLMSVKIENFGQKKALLQSAIAGLLPVLNNLTLGVDVEDSLQHINDQIFGNETTGEKSLMTLVKENARSHVTELETLVSIAPIVDSTGKNTSGEFIAQSIAGWDTLTGALDSLVAELQTHLANALDKSFDETAREAEIREVQRLTTMIINITSGTQQALSAAEANFQLAADLSGINLSDMSDSTVTAAASAYKDYQQQIREGLLTQTHDVYMEAVRLSASLKIQAGYALEEGRTDDANALMAQAEEIIASAEAAKNYYLTNMDKIVAEMSEPGRVTLMEAISQNAFGGREFSVSQIGNIMIPNGVYDERKLSAVKKLLDAAGFNLYDVGKMKEIDRVLKSTMVQNMGDFEQTIGQMISVLGAGNSQEAVKTLVEMYKALGLYTKTDYGIKEGMSDWEAMMAIWESYIKGAEYTGAPIVPTVDLDTTEATGKADELNSYIANLSPTMKVGVEFTGVFGAVAGLLSPFFAAEGGMFTTGQMFIAREAGPEMVGSIGRRSAVANNDQIVSGIAGGVAAGQEEQNALLRQQNDYLRKILAKEGNVTVTPSAEWGGFNRKSNEMYARNTGVSV